MAFDLQKSLPLPVLGVFPLDFGRCWSVLIYKRHEFRQNWV